MPYVGPVTDPFRIPAPDGNTYFDVFTAPLGLIPVYRGLAAIITRIEKEEINAKANARRALTPQERAAWNVYAAFWGAWLVRFQLLSHLLVSQLAEIGRQTAVVADQSIRRHIKSTQVRPDTGKARHMEDNIFSRHIPQRAEGAAVGIADISILDKTRRSNKGGTYWEAQEFGTDAHVGRTVHGFFMPGQARPSQGSFRTHSEFQASRTASKMLIQRPIQERGFLRQGIEDAGAFRLRRLNTLEQKVRREIDKFISAARGVRAPLAVTPRRPRK